MRRNIFRGPAYANLDMSVTKRWNLSERVSLQLRSEFFNILNHPNFDLFTMRTRLSIRTLSGDRATPDVGVANPVVGRVVRAIFNWGRNWSGSEYDGKRTIAVPLRIYRFTRSGSLRQNSAKIVHPAAGESTRSG
jgi:hypothetical protein